MVWVEVTNVNFNLLTFVIAKLQDNNEMGHDIHTFLEQGQ